MIKTRMRLSVAGVSILAISATLFFFQNCAKTYISSGGINAFSSAADSAVPLSCSFDGKSIDEGGSVMAFPTSTVPIGQACVAEKIVCSRGVFSGSARYSFCNVGAPAACLFSGTTIPDGQAVDGYKSANVAAGEMCAKEVRTCRNGVLSGAFQFSSCLVAAPVDPSAALSVYVRPTEARLGADLVFKIELNKTNATPVVVQVNTAAGTALPAVDYTELSTAVTIPAGQLSATVTIPSVHFKANTETKTMSLVATSTSAGIIAQKVATGTIVASQRIELFKQIASGGYHTCAITLQDTVKCWGGNFAGQLGNNSRADSIVAVDVMGLSGIKAISLGRTYSCAITAQDTVKCWGDNDSPLFQGSCRVS